MNDLELGWVAGILEGEGCFSVKKKSIVVSVGMTDMDTVYRFQKIVGKGSIQTPKRTKGGKLLYTWYLGMREDVVTFLGIVHPLMSKRRSEKIAEMLKWHEDNPKGRPYRNATSHGSTRMYNYYKCRCDVCKDGMSLYRKSRKGLIKNEEPNS